MEEIRREFEEQEIRNERKEGGKICYWNEVDLERKDRDFRKKSGQWEVVVMETWLDRRG